MRNLWVCLLLIGCGAPSRMSGDDTPGDDVDGGIILDGNTDDSQMVDAFVCTANTQVDSNNCGACGRSCLGGSCSAGMCTTTRMDGGNTTGFGDVYTDGLFTYYTGFSGTTNPHRIWRIPLSSGTASHLGVIFNSTPMSQIAFEGSDFYVVEPNRIDTLDRGNVRKIGKEPFSESTLINFLEPTTTATFVYNGFVYWATDVDGDNAGDIKKMPIGGGQVSTVTVNAGFVQYMKTDGTNVYWIGGGSLKKAPLSAGPPVVLGAATSPTLDLDSTHVYALNSNGIVRAPLGGGGAVSFASASLSTGVAADAEYVYAAQGDNKLLGFPKAGGNPVTMWTEAATNLGGNCFLNSKITRLKVLNDYVYFSVAQINSCGNVLQAEGLYRTPRM